MIITEIREQKKDSSRCSVYIDGVFAFGILKKDAEYFKLKEGAELARERYDFIMHNLVYIKAQDMALSFISSRMRTLEEVRKKLADNEYPDEIAAEVLKFLKKYGYADDAAYCAAYIRECRKLRPKGRRLIEYELRLKGAGALDIEKAFELEEYDELEAANMLAAKKMRRRDALDAAAKRKLEAMLERRGFGWEVIKEAVSSQGGDELE